jgi:gliding motility-associated-like protein
MGGGLIRSVQATPATFTPNGDGVNDQVAIAYELRDLESRRQIRLRIYDLSGRLVRQIAANTGSGSFAQTWNGRDEKGALVPPGMYLYQLDWDTDEGREVANGAVGVAY